MTITFTEKWDSRKQSTGANARAEKKYIATGTGADDPDTVRAAAILDETVGALLYVDLILQSIDAERIAEEACEVVVKYGLLKPPEKGDSSYEFSTIGSQQHVTQALSTVSSHTISGRPVIDFKGAIGVTKDGVNGTDIPGRKFDFSETHYLADLAVSDSYKATLYNLTPSWNAAEFRGFPAGTCLYRGTTGGKRGEDQWELTYHFTSTPNEEDLQIGDIVVPNKLGWDYLDVYYEVIEDAESSRLIKVPRQVDVKRVIQVQSFSQLGIGS